MPAGESQPTGRSESFSDSRCRQGTATILTRLGALSSALATLVMTVGLMLMSAAPASAHTELVSVVPAAGATVSVAPSIVTLVFNDALRAPSFIVVTGPDGARVQQGETSVVDTKVRSQVRVSKAGRYTIAQHGNASNVLFIGAIAGLALLGGVGYLRSRGEHAKPLPASAEKGSG